MKNHFLFNYPKLIVLFFFIQAGCEKVETNAELPVVATTEIINITENTAIGGGLVSGEGASPVIEKGVCWSETESPTTSDNRTEDSGGIGAFTSILTGLEPGKTYFVRAYATSSNGTSYGNQETFEVPDSGVFNYNAQDGLLSNIVTSIAVDNQNNIWVGTNAGLSKFDGILWTNFTKEDGLVDNDVTSLATDHEGNLWVGTRGGISKFTGTDWVNYVEEYGLYSSRVYSIFVDNSGVVWFGLNRNRLAKFDGLQFESYHVYPEETDLAGHIHTVCQDLEGNLWVGSCYTGLSKFDGVNWTHWINNITSFVNTSICSSVGGVWVGYSLGISHFGGNSWIDYYQNDLGAHSFVEDTTGKIWCGTIGSKLLVFENNVWTEFEKNGLLINESIFALANDKDGAIWAGGHNGITRILNSQ